MTKSTRPVYRDSWFEGYDGEYEYSVTVYRDRIEWELEFDEQWRDKPVRAVQDPVDFVKNGPPFDFAQVNSYYLKEVGKAVRRILSKESAE